mgnify:CR=1 FL=1
MRRSQDLTVCTSVSEFTAAIDSKVFAIAERRHKRHVTEYVNTTATLDIEDYADAEDGYIYSIAVNIGGVNVDVRYIEDAFAIFDYLVDRFTLSPDRKLVIYVHNLGHEHYHMTQIMAPRYGNPEILLTKSTKPLLITYSNGLEFRDSFKLFQKSLAGATKGLLHAKLKGDLDYSKHFTPDTPLNQKEFDYIVNDVQGLYEAIERLKREHGYNQATIPYTNTGMVIEAVNRKCDGDAKTHKAMTDLLLNRDQLELAYRCTAGGDTHGCRWRAGKTFYNCNSYDLKSAHPSQQILRKFPAGRPVTINAVEEPELQNFINVDYGWYGLVYIEGVCIEDECPDPTISVSKCADIVGMGDVDNGRLLNADAILVYMDSNDYQRFIEAYDYEYIQAQQIVTFRLEYLPDAFRGAILDYFRIKESQEDGPERVFAKICVNTIFGACDQKVIRDEYSVNLETMEATMTSWAENLKNASDKEISEKQAKKFPFLWGLWTASMSRLALFRLIKTVGWDRAIYWDTDSCKYEGEKVDAVDSVYNQEVRDQCEARGAVVMNRKGKTVFIGSAEDEHPAVSYGYKAFRFLHAKCYAAEAWDGSDYTLESTIAGVGKAEGVAALNGNINNLKDGLMIEDAGGLALTYHDRPLFTRTDFERPTLCASYIEMNPRSYLVNDQHIENDESEICAE